MCHTTQNVVTHLCILPPPPRAKHSKQTSFPHNEHTAATRPRTICRGLSFLFERLQELGDAIGAQVLPNGEEFHMQSIFEAMLEDFKLTVGGETDQTSENTRSGY